MPLLKGIIAPFLAAIAGFMITAYGEGIWGTLVLANLRIHPELPWAAIAMTALLAGLIAYLAGFGPSPVSKADRRRLLRWNSIPPEVFFFAIFAGILADIALGGVWIATSDLIHIPPGITPSMRGVPVLTALSFLVMGSLAAPISEEAAFRGYAQGILENAWKWAPAAIVGSSALFALAHFTQGLFLPKLGLYFLAGLIFGTIAYLTNSLYAAMIVHSFGDFEGFLLLWPHDAHPHALITEGGHDPLFVPAVVVTLIFVPLAVWVLKRLGDVARGRPAGSRRANANPAAA